MKQITNTEAKILELLKKDPYLEQEEIALRLGMSRSSVAGHLARLIKKGFLQRGYILSDSGYEIAVIGGANVDIKGIAGAAFRLATSNPGQVSKSPGGVARNVAENLARLHLAVSLYTAVGLDSEGEWLVKKTAEAGVNVQHIEHLAGERTGIYLSILDDRREQIASISDMAIIERLNTDYLTAILANLLHAKMVFLDTNLPQSSLALLINWLKEQNIPIIIDPVSAKKAEKLQGLLNGLFLITPNKEEAEVLSGLPIRTAEDLPAVANKLLSQGVKQLIITLGQEGVFIADAKQQLLLPSSSTEIVDTTGAGDSFIAGVIYGLTKGASIIAASRYGSALASLTLASKQTVVADLTAKMLEKRMKEIIIDE